MIMHSKRYLYLYLLSICWILYSAPAVANDNSSIPSFGKWSCDILYRITYILPKTPSDMLLSTLSNKIGQNIEFIGKGIFYAVISDVRDVLLLIAGWKIFKALPNF